MGTLTVRALIISSDGFLKRKPDQAKPTPKPFFLRALKSGASASGSKQARMDTEQGSKEPISWCNLAQDALVLIFDNISLYYRLRSCSLVCRRWRDAVRRSLRTLPALRTAAATVAAIKSLSGLTAIELGCVPSSHSWPDHLAFPPKLTSVTMRTCSSEADDEPHDCPCRLLHPVSSLTHLSTQCCGACDGKLYEYVLRNNASLLISLEMYRPKDKRGLSKLEMPLLKRLLLPYWETKFVERVACQLTALTCLSAFDGLPSIAFPRVRVLSLEQYDTLLSNPLHLDEGELLSNCPSLTSLHIGLGQVYNSELDSLGDAFARLAPHVVSFAACPAIESSEATLSLASVRHLTRLTSLSLLAHHVDEEEDGKVVSTVSVSLKRLRLGLYPHLTALNVRLLVRHLSALAQLPQLHRLQLCILLERMTKVAAHTQVGPSAVDVSLSRKGHTARVPLFSQLGFPRLRWCVLRLYDGEHLVHAPPLLIRSLLCTSLDLDSIYALLSLQHAASALGVLQCAEQRGILSFIIEDMSVATATLMELRSCLRGIDLRVGYAPSWAGAQAPYQERKCEELPPCTLTESEDEPLPAMSAFPCGSVTKMYSGLIWEDTDHNQMVAGDDDVATQQFWLPPAVPDW